MNPSAIAAVAPTLDSSFGRLQGASGQDAKHGHGHLLAFGGNNTAGPIDVSTALNAHGGPMGRMDFESETFVAQAIAFNGRQDPDVTGDRAGSLNGMSPQDQCIAYGLDSDIFDRSGEGASGTAGERAGLGITAEHTNALRAKRPNGVAHGWAVRRLTPTECERLQGFPDGYTAIPFRGKPAADGPRYKALGNSWAVNAARWIGYRIQMVDEVWAEIEAARRAAE